MTNRDEETLVGTEWEAAAAELTAAMSEAHRSRSDALPTALASRLTSLGEAMVREQRAAIGGRETTTASAPPVPSTTSVNVDIVPISRVPKRFGMAAWGGWLSAAAILALWVSGVGRSSGGSNQSSAVVASGPSLSAGAQLRDSLLASDSALVRLAWKATEDSTAAGATGDVVWSERAQRGVMRIAGLAPNDRKRFQYQLWIFDKKRDQRYPVDGGVFDIPAGATEVFVPIDARVPVGDVAMFAVTVEPPGGVVVSTRERIALLASE
ncbi:MAG: anti-sigma factor [Gemmatimonadaceae bacterium]|nr:anti-sigma factor [Gemmatimonadaceae bacterium]